MTRREIRRRSRSVSLHLLPLMGETMSGFFVGILLTKLLNGYLMDSVGFLEEDSLQYLSQVCFLPRSLFFYFLKRRWTELVFLLLLFMTFIGKVGFAFYLFGISLMQGTFFMILVQHYAWKGIGLFLVAAFPQGFLLLLSIGLLWNLNRRLYTSSCHVGCGGDITNQKSLLWEVTVCFLLQGAAAWLQSYVNPFFLQKYLNFF